ncbi:hypothetical protein Fot_05171 [Forsythia ovata]|uniref:F-box associated beta-propeller type 1 domain-containing protein n=1 Tax=Forsythia ovata TaxID=205694 RepID=A0ABD1WPS2_9LAMI
MDERDKLKYYYNSKPKGVGKLMDEIWERAVETALDGENDVATVRTLTLDGAAKCVHGRLPPPSIFEKFCNLQHLSIANIGLSSLEHFPRLRNLQKLVLSDNRIAGGLEFLVEAGLEFLRDLDLSNNRISEINDLRPLALLSRVSNSHHPSNGFLMEDVGDESEEDDDSVEEIYEEEEGEDDDVVEVHEIDDSDEDGVEDDEDDDEEDVNDDEGNFEERNSRLINVEGEIDGHEQGEEDDHGEMGEEDLDVEEDGDFEDEDEEEDNGTGYLIQPVGQVHVDAEMEEDINDEDDQDGEVWLGIVLHLVVEKHGMGLTKLHVKEPIERNQLCTRGDDGPPTNHTHGVQVEQLCLVLKIMELVQDKIKKTDDDAGKYVSSKSTNKKTTSESSGTEIDDIFGVFGTDQFITAAYQKIIVNAYEFPAHVKPMEDTEIKDIVKDHALPYLPAKSLMRFRAVSKEWDQWITSPFFSHKQSNSFRDMSGFFHQSQNRTTTSFISLSKAAYGIPDVSLKFLPEPVVIRSSCNGLLLCQEAFGEKKYYVCNPSNKKWKAIPFPNFYQGEEPAILLAFEPSVFNFEADYHLICAVPMLDNMTVHFEIYSSETRSWKHSAAVCVELEDSIIKSNGFYMEGIAYWETSSDDVLAFDFKNDIYQVLVLPSERAPDGVLTRFHGELCYVCGYNQSGNLYTVNIYGNMSLKHSLFFDLEELCTQHCRVLPCINSDFVNILARGKLYCYNLKDQKFEVVSFKGIWDHQANYLPYVNSLAPVVKIV